METEWKADQKYKKWLQTKNQEKSELERKEKVCPSARPFFLIHVLFSFTLLLKMTFL